MERKQSAENPKIPDAYESALADLGFEKIHLNYDDERQTWIHHWLFLDQTSAIGLVAVQDKHLPGIADWYLGQAEPELVADLDPAAVAEVFMDCATQVNYRPETLRYHLAVLTGKESVAYFSGPRVQIPNPSQLEYSRAIKASLKLAQLALPRGKD